MFITADEFYNLQEELESLYDEEFRLDAEIR
jgi:hypothetical protein